VDDNIPALEAAEEESDVPALDEEPVEDGAGSE